MTSSPLADVLATTEALAPDRLADALAHAIELTARELQCDHVTAAAFLIDALAKVQELAAPTLH
jgi:hypothetical protein